MARPEPDVVVFLGVTTGASFVNEVFPAWAGCLGRHLRLQGLDLPLRSPPKAYRKFVEGFRDNERGWVGALITSHKASLYDAASDLFDTVTPAARRLKEVGMIYWRLGQLVADANDALSTRRILRRLLGQQPAWTEGGHRAVILGGGGAGVALAEALAFEADIACRGIVLCEINGERVEALQHLIAEWTPPIGVEVLQVELYADVIIRESPPGTLIANATGLGKDRPGSPVSPHVVFPPSGIVWEFNYRFKPQEAPTFLEIATVQAQSRGLIIETGWDYFVWGWLAVLSSTLGVEPDRHYPCFVEAADAAGRRPSY